MTQPTLFTASQLANKGIEKAVNHANGVTPEWSVMAWEALLEYLHERGQGAKFLNEDFLLWVRLKNKCPMPPSNRAWGGQILRAKHLNLIESAGIGKTTSPNQRGCFSTIWKIK